MNCAIIASISGGGGGDGTSGATRDSCDAGSPIQKSSPSGFATSSAKNVPRLLPLTRRTSSPARWPYVTAWYPCFVPGSQTGACAASASTSGVHAKTSSAVSVRSITGRPARCDISTRTGISPFPSAANSGQ